MRNKKIIVTAITTVVLLAGIGGVLFSNILHNKEDKTVKKAVTIKEVSIEKSNNGNPILGFDSNGKQIYGGDPAALVDGEKVYLYTGHDTATSSAYKIPEWQCYSSTDMVNWSYEGVILKCTDISWASDKNAAWASQAIKHYDTATGKDKYYFYFCSWDRTSDGKQSIGVAVSDSPTGPFTDIGAPLVKGTLTANQSSNWNDIDPTVWIETGSDGVEHRYVCWGNGKNYICELNEDMISVKDLDGNGSIEFGKDIIEKTAPNSYTEAPWLYRQQDENGNYYGKYYLFYASGWREQIAYATTDDLINGKWEFGGILQPPTATSNTNHMSVIDFKGTTYFIYHNGSLSGGNGYKRVACIEKMSINSDGTIDQILETSTGINGKVSTIKDGEGNLLGHNSFTNSSSDSAYPYLNVLTGIKLANTTDDDCAWEILPGKSDPSNEYYVSIEAYNKPGLYLTVNNGNVRLAQDSTGNMAQKQTFKTVTGLSGDGISFESLIDPGNYITIGEDGKLTMSKGENPEACSFTINNVK